MNENGRIQNSIKNTLIGVSVQILSVLLSFITRIIFVRSLSEEYLGVNGLFTNILTVLSLAELGVGTAIIYSLYLSVAQKNEKEIAELLNFYKKAYLIIGCVITVVGVLIAPFLDIFIKDAPNIPNLHIIYLMFVANSSCSYLFAYRRSIFLADQREYVLSEYRLFFIILKAVGQCMSLLFTKNFYYYLLVQIVCTLCENICIHVKTLKYYPFLKEYKKAVLSKQKVHSIQTDIKALMIYKIGSTALDGTDNIILSMFVGVVSVGKLSNYTLIVSAVAMVTSQILNSITASVGNFIAKESSERHEELLFKITFMSFFIYGFSFVALSCLMSPFIQMIFGINYILTKSEVFICSLNFYIFGMMNSIWTFRTTMGLFTHGRYRPLVSAMINIIVSVILARYIGLLGVLLGTTITRLVTNVWYDPYIVYKYGVKKSAVKYYRLWMKYLALSLISIVISQRLIHFLPELDIFVFFIECFICIGVFFSTLYFATSKCEEFLFFKKLVKGQVKKYF